MSTSPHVVCRQTRDGLIAAIALSLTCSAVALAQDGRQSMRAFADPGSFTRMYVAFGLMQAVDVHSTIVTLRAGAKEANPLMGGVAGNPAALIAVKAASAAGTIYCVERLRKRNRVAAAITMAALDTAYAMVVMNNARVMAKANLRV